MIQDILFASPWQFRKILIVQLKRNLLNSVEFFRMSSINSDKLAKLQAQANADGIRRKTKKTSGRIAGGDDKKLQAALKKLNAQPIPNIEEINMFQDDGNVLHFKVPKGKV